MTIEKQDQMNNQHELLTVGEVANILRCDVSTVRRWAKAGALEAVKLPSHGKWQALRIKRATIDAMLDGQKGV